MNTINISKRKFDTLEPFILPNSVMNTEAQLFIFPIKNRWENQTKLLKKFYLTSGMNFGNKLQTINSLIDYRDTIDIEEIVFPEKLAIVNQQAVGYIMPLIQSVNLDIALKSGKVPIETKIRYLKEIGELLERMRKVRRYTELKDFYLNDIHENNFIIDTTTDHIKVVDIDSCKINDNFVFGAKYLSPRSLISSMGNLNKYKRENRLSCGGHYIPSIDTELYCYIIMILNFLSGVNINNMTPEEYYDYLDYLISIGINKELIDIFEKVLTNTDNENPYELLDTLIPYAYQSHHNVYTYIKKKKR